LTAKTLISASLAFVVPIMAITLVTLSRLSTSQLCSASPSGMPANLAATLFTMLCAICAKRYVPTLYISLADSIRKSLEFATSA
jgi:hypothetical protein